MLSANVFDIQRASFVDGPGIRTTIFFSGCNLRCQWCHNPEGIGLPGVTVPPSYETRAYSIGELVDLVSEDVPFYGDEGGVTCSGGECMLQADFLEHFLAVCQSNGINTCVDTAGNVPFASFEKVLPYTDTFLFDVKCIDPCLHKAFTGVSNTRILDNLTRLSSLGANLIIRVPLIPEFNGNRDELLRIKSFLESLHLKYIELLPYHTLGEGKYNKLHLPFAKFTVPNHETMDEFKTILGV